MSDGRRNSPKPKTQSTGARKHRVGGSARTGRAIEWPTILIGVLVHVFWFGSVFFFTKLPFVLAVALLGIATAWHSSFQHELIHGHPFRRTALNNTIGWLPLGLWFPYELYRVSHLKHHRNEILTDPLDDPESYYATRLGWFNMSPLMRTLLWCNRTLLGRIIIGPWLSLFGYLRSEFRAVTSGDRERAQTWALHLPLAVGVAWFAIGVANIRWWAFIAGDVYLGTALILLRSFAEHRWVSETSSRSALVEAGLLWRLLYLNNNLHLAHHQRPGAPWYELPQIAKSLRSDREAANGAGLYAGYADVFRRYAVKPFCQPVHPSEGALEPWRLSGPATGSKHSG